MNWKLVLYLSLFGPAMGAFVVMGVFPEGTEKFAWIVPTMVWSLVIARNMDEGHFQHGAVVGFIAGATSTLVKAFFPAALVSHNPWIIDAFAEMPEGFDLQFFVFMLVPFVGIGSAFVGGVLSLLSARVMKRVKEGGD